MVTSLGMFNDESGYNAENPEQDVVAQLTLQDMTISQIASFADDPFKLLHLNIDDPNISPNDKHLILVNSGNDEALKAYMEDISASNSGRSSNLNSGTAELGDAMMQAPENSVHDPKMHRDTAFSSKAERAEERQANHHSNWPEIFPDEQSLAIAETQVVAELQEAGVPQNLLDEASYGANGMEDRFAAYEQLAEEYQVDGLKDYVNEMQGVASGEEPVEVAQVQNEIKPPELTPESEATPVMGMKNA